MAVKARLVYYALGGGLGHLTRARAITGTLAHLAPDRFQITLLTNSSHAGSIVGGANEVIPILSETELEPALERVFSSVPDLLIVDTFPRGLMGELTVWLEQLTCPTILIQRYLNELYIEQYAIVDFVGEHYDRVLRLADNLPRQTLSAATIDLPPVTILGQISPARRHLPQLFEEVDQRSRVLFIDFGPASDAYLAAIPASFAVRVLTPDTRRLSILPGATSYYPAAALFGQADLIVGACGYNLYHEVVECCQPAIFLPQPKTYDDQFGRARGTAHAASPPAFAELLARWEKPIMACPVPHYGEGARAAAQAILQTIK